MVPHVLIKFAKIKKLLFYCHTQNVKISRFSGHSLYPEHQLSSLPDYQIPKLAIVCYVQLSFVFQNSLEFSLWEKCSRRTHTAVRMTKKAIKILIYITPIKILNKHSEMNNHLKT